MPPLVSVIIPAYNAGRFIRETVESALNQTYPHLEVIVVDDGSPQPVAQVVEADPARVRYIRKPNGGPASARNAGLRRSRGELVAFLDADDVWEPDKLAAQVAALEAYPTAGLAYAAVRKIDAEGRPLPPGPPARRPSGRIFPELFMRNIIPTSTVVVRRSCLEQAGLFDEAPELISVEDYDLWLRVAERFEVVAVDRPLARYRINDAGISRPTARSYGGERLVIERAVARSRASRPELAALLPRRLAQLHFACGHEYFTANRLAEAREQFAQSLRHRPWHLRAVAYYLATCLGSSGVALARRVKIGTAALFLSLQRQKKSSGPNFPIRILHLLNTLEMGGAEQVVLNLAQHIDREMFQMQVCGLGGEGPLAEEFRRLGVRVHAMHRRPGIDLRLALHLARLLRRERIGVVHTHNAAPWLYGGVAAKLACLLPRSGRQAGARLIHTEHSNLFPHQRRLMAAERWLARVTDVIIADSEKVKRHLVERQGIPEADVRTVVNGVDVGRFVDGAAPAEARQALGLNGARPVIGTVGRLVPVKDHRTLLEAFRRVVDAHPASSLVMVGDGPLRGELVHLAGTLGIGERVRFLGERQDIPALLRAFDLFVLSSISEGMPLTVLEAMAAGLPVVATRVGGVSEAVVDQHTGWLVSPRNPHEMAEAMLALLADPPRRVALGAEAQQRVRERFDLHRMVDAYESAYRHQPVS